MIARTFPILLSLFLLSDAFAQRSRFFVSRWLESFHETQNLDDFDKALLVWRVRETMDDAEARQPVIAFLSFLFANHPQTIAQALGDDPSELTAGQKATFAAALLRAGTETSKNALRSIGYTSWLAQPKPTPVPQLKIGLSTEMDLCWGYFFASGDVSALQPVVAVLDFAQFADTVPKFQALLQPAFEADAKALLAGQKGIEAEVEKQLDLAKNARIAATNSPFYEEATKFAMFEAAAWSLGRQAAKNPDVRAFLQAQLENANLSRTAQTQLSEILRAIPAPE